MSDRYHSFQLALYCTAKCLDKPMEVLEEELAFFRRHLKLDKVYIENHRGDTSLSRERLEELKRFFVSQGLHTAGGITATLGGAYRPGHNRLLNNVCYTDTASRDRIREAAETAAAVFDELILDDFFFTSCTCGECRKQKGSRSWEEFRLALMAEVSEQVIIGPAKAVNPRIKVVIKYPNWNESYAESGYHTACQPDLFDGIYTGTETRDTAITQQHLPRYASYSLMRWMENAAPGRNGGGWFDALDCTFVDYYLEQANLTVFGKARELALFCYSHLHDHVYVPALGHRLDKLDQLKPQLGQPVGACVYKPHQTRAPGEDHLYNILGMMGIPLELSPAVPLADPLAVPLTIHSAERDSPPPHTPVATENPNVPVPAACGTLLVAADAAGDKDILAKVVQFLEDGGHLIMTSGFVSAMSGRGAGELAPVYPTGAYLEAQHYALHTDICSFHEFYPAGYGDRIRFPVLDFATNATWQKIVAWNGPVNTPVLLSHPYGPGRVSVLAVPEQPSDLLKLPAEVTTQLRYAFTEGLLPFRLSGPSPVGLFAYNNSVFVLESFALQPAAWKAAVPPGTALRQLTPATIAQPLRLAAVRADGWREYTLSLHPSTYAAYKLVPDEGTAP